MALDNLRFRSSPRWKSSPHRDNGAGKSTLIKAIRAPLFRTKARSGLCKEINFQHAADGRKEPALKPFYQRLPCRRHWSITEQSVHGPGNLRKAGLSRYGACASSTHKAMDAFARDKTQ